MRLYKATVILEMLGYGIMVPVFAILFGQLEPNLIIGLFATTLLGKAYLTKYYDNINEFKSLMKIKTSIMLLVLLAYLTYFVSGIFLYMVVLLKLMEVFYSIAHRSETLVFNSDMLKFLDKASIIILIGLGYTFLLEYFLPIGSYFQFAIISVFILDVANFLIRVYLLKNSETYKIK